jgi:hypothetical protein
MHRPIMILGGLVVVVAARAGAQARPNYSGTWTRVVEAGAESGPSVATVGDAAFRVGDMGSGWGSPLTITQRADSLIVEFPHFSDYDLQPPLRFAYALDGSESRNGVMIGHATSLQRSRILWQDGELTISTVYPAPPGAAPGGSVEVRQTLSLESPAALVLTTTRTRSGAPAIVTRTAYTKR